MLSYYNLRHLRQGGHIFNPKHIIAFSIYPVQIQPHRLLSLKHNQQLGLSDYKYYAPDSSESGAFFAHNKEKSV